MLIGGAPCGQQQLYKKPLWQARKEESKAKAARRRPAEIK